MGRRLRAARAAAALSSRSLRRGRSPRSSRSQGARGRIRAPASCKERTGASTGRRLRAARAAAVLSSRSRRQGRSRRSTRSQGATEQSVCRPRSRNRRGLLWNDSLRRHEHFGTVFKITSLGALTTLHRFTHQDGAGPYAGLVQGTDGSFYGTTTGGGDIFLQWALSSRSRRRGRLRLSTRSGTTGQSAGLPRSGNRRELLRNDDQGGASGFGTVFRITPAGALTTLSSFAGSDGRYPYAGLVQGTDGNFYGTTNTGGASDYGTVFKIIAGRGADHASLLRVYQRRVISVCQPRARNGRKLLRNDVSRRNGGRIRNGLQDYAGRHIGDAEMFRFVDGSNPRAGLVQGSRRALLGTTSWWGRSQWDRVPSDARPGAFSHGDKRLPCERTRRGGTVVTISGSDSSQAPRCFSGARRRPRSRISR